MSSDSGPKTHAAGYNLAGPKQIDVAAGAPASADWIADYRARAASLPVMARAEPGDVKRPLPACRR
jgi:hypothetical protein